MKRKFYIIAHNPDHISKAENALKNGANAIEPDIRYSDGDFWIYDEVKMPYNPTLKEYLIELATLLLNNPAYNLALIAWDLKNTENSNFDLWKIQNYINEYFTIPLMQKGYGSIPMLFTTPHNFTWLTTYAAPYIKYNQAIGTDQYDNPGHAENYFKGKGYAFTYAYGSDFSPNSQKVEKAISDAITIRDKGNSFSLVYVWTVNNHYIEILIPNPLNILGIGPNGWTKTIVIDNYKKYLGLNVDGIITDKPHELLSELSNYSNYELATKDYNPFARLAFPPTFKVRTYQFLPDEIFVAMNDVGGNSTLLKFKNPAGTGHNMFAVSTDGHGNYASLPNYDYLLGSQLFQASIVDIVYASGSTIIALSNGQVLKIAGTGGTGENMFAVTQQAGQSASVSYGNDSFSAVTVGNYTYPYYLGDQSFTNPVTLLKFMNGYLYIGLSDGWLIKINGTGGTGHDMFNITETTDGFVSNPNYNTYWMGDQKFNDFVRGMQYIPVAGGALFIWFNNGKLLKLNGTDAGGHTMFNITESSDGFEQIPGFYQYYIGDQLFSALVNTVCYSSYDYTFIGLDNGAILKVTHIGGTGHTMFNITETNDGFEQVPGFAVYMAGNSFFYNCSIQEIQVFAGDLYIAISFNDSTGSVLLIRGAGGTGSNMFAVQQNGIVFKNITPYNYYIGDENTIVPVNGLNFISEGPMNNIWNIYVEFANGLLLKAALGGTGNDMFAITMNQTAVYPLPGYDYYIGEQYLP